MTPAGLFCVCDRRLLGGGEEKEKDAVKDCVQLGKGIGRSALESRKKLENFMTNLGAFTRPSGCDSTDSLGARGARGSLGSLGSLHSTRVPTPHSDCTYCTTGRMNRLQMPFIGLALPFLDNRIARRHHPGAVGTTGTGTSGPRTA